MKQNKKLIRASEKIIWARFGIFIPPFLYGLQVGSNPNWLDNTTQKCETDIKWHLTGGWKAEKDNKKIRAIGIWSIRNGLRETSGFFPEMNERANSKATWLVKILQKTKKTDWPMTKQRKNNWSRTKLFKKN